jgi:hypothetical protein
LAVLFASAFAAKEEKEKKKVEEPAKKTSTNKTEKRGAEELLDVPVGVEDHELIGRYAGSYEQGVAGYELGDQQRLSLLGYGAHSLNPISRIKSIVITKEVAIPVPHPYPVPVEKTVPYPVHVPVPFPVVKHYPVPVPKPYPVPVEKKVPYPVEKIVPYPVKVPVKVAVPVPHAVPVPQPYPVPVHVTHSIPVPQPIILSKPVAVFQEHSGLAGGYEGLGGHERVLVGYSDGEHGNFGVGYGITTGVDGQYANRGYN